MTGWRERCAITSTEQIEALFAALRSSSDMTIRQHALKELAVVLTAHANAEEAVIYPALVHFAHKAQGMVGYTEQADANTNMGELEYLNTMGAGFLDRLEHIRGAVAHHMYEEESDRFLQLNNLPSSDQARLTSRYQPSSCWARIVAGFCPAKLARFGSELCRLDRSTTNVSRKCWTLTLDRN